MSARRPTTGALLIASPVDVWKAIPRTAVVFTVVLILGSSAALASRAAGSTSATADDASERTGSDGRGADGAETDPAATDSEALLAEGAAVYSQVCSSCHQPGGAGLPGQYPPLLANPRVDDASYVAETIVNGKRGRIEVLGETYDGVMPSFSTLPDEDVAAVIAYIQNDFEAPRAAVDAFERRGAVAGTELPELATMSAAVAYAVALGVAGLVLAPRLTSVNDRLAVPWLDAALKTAAIVAAVVVLAVLVPNWALNTGPVSKLSRFGQDVIGVGLFGMGLGAVLAGLWYAHRESRI